MIVLKYTKSDSACFISHIDLLKHVARILRRGKIDVKFSQGFNPHALVFFSPPLVVGVTSNCEYLSIDCDEDASEVFAKYNGAVPQGLIATKHFVCNKNPNLQAKIVAADYVFDIPYRDLKIGDEFVINYTKKGEQKTENVADKIYAIENYNGKLLCRVQAGNVSLRPDRMLPTLNAMCGTNSSLVDVVKIRQYVMGNDGRFVDVDEVLEKGIF